MFFKDISLLCRYVHTAFELSYLKMEGLSTMLKKRSIHLSTTRFEETVRLY